MGLACRLVCLLADDVVEEVLKQPGTLEASVAVALLLVDDEPGHRADGIGVGVGTICDHHPRVVGEVAQIGRQRDALHRGGDEVSRAVADRGGGDAESHGVLRADVADRTRGGGDHAGDTGIALGGIAHLNIQRLGSAQLLAPHRVDLAHIAREDEGGAAAVRAVDRDHPLVGQGDIGIELPDRRVVPCRDPPGVYTRDHLRREPKLLNALEVVGDDDAADAGGDVDDRHRHGLGDLLVGEELVGAAKVHRRLGQIALTGAAADTAVAHMDALRIAILLRHLDVEGGRESRTGTAQGLRPGAAAQPRNEHQTQQGVDQKLLCHNI